MRVEGRGWLLFAFWAFFLSGTAQYLARFPSFFPEAGVAPLLRMCLTQSGIVLAAVMSGLLFMKKKPDVNRNVFVAALCFGVYNHAALYCFYKSLGLLALNGYASIGYPAGQGLSIAVFFLLNRFYYRCKSS